MKIGQRMAPPGSAGSDTLAWVAGCNGKHGFEARVAMRRQRGRLETWCWVMAWLACAGMWGQTPELPSEGTVVRVHGVVLDGVTQAPVPRALVTTADQHMAVRADGEGRFEFEVRDPGADQGPRDAALGTTFTSGGRPDNVLLQASQQFVMLMARKPGYRPMQRGAMVPLGDRDALRRVVRLELMPLGTLVGHVTAAGVDGPAGVSVQLSRRQVQDGAALWQMDRNVQTNSHGEYRFSDLEPGEYRLGTTEWVEREGRSIPVPGRPQVGYPPVLFAPDGGGSIHLKGGRSVVADLTLRAADYHDVALPVADGAGDSVSVAVRSEAAGAGFSLGYNVRRQQVEGSLPDGVYHVTVTGYGQPGGPNQPQPLRFGFGEVTVAGKAVRGVPIALHPGGVIPVRVREEFTAPDPNQGSEQGLPAGVLGGGISSGGLVGPAGAAVAVVKPRSVEVFLQPLDPDGMAVGLSNPVAGGRGDEGLLIENVRPGRYRVVVSPRRGYVGVLTANGVDLLRGPLVVEAGGGSPSIEMVLRDDTATVEGTVPRALLRGEVELSGYGFVTAVPLGELAFSRSTRMEGVSLDGKFTLSAVPPGRYLLLLNPGGVPNLEFRNEEAMKPYLARGKVVEVGSKETVSVALTVNEAPEDGPLGEGVD